jgi:hypothetical protein
MEMKDEPSHARLMLRELPRRKLALVLIIVTLNLGVVKYLRGRAMFRERQQAWLDGKSRGRAVDWVRITKTSEDVDRLDLLEPVFIPPWQGSSDDGAETVWPWK